MRLKKERRNHTSWWEIWGRKPKGKTQAILAAVCTISKVDPTALTGKFTSEPWKYSRARQNIVWSQKSIVELWEPLFDRLTGGWIVLFSSIHWLLYSNSVTYDPVYSLIIQTDICLYMHHKQFHKCFAKLDAGSITCLLNILNLVDVQIPQWSTCGLLTISPVICSYVVSHHNCYW